MKNKLFTLIFACLTFFAIPVLAKEKIDSFDSLIQVQTDGSMIVTETITVHHEGIKIRRGIYRDLPTKKGEKYKLISVNRNGHHEPGFVERRYGYYRINTGDDNFLPHPATSTFEIKYKVWNLPKSYNGYDEVYWNVTGDEWAFPIEKVSAKMELPHGVDIIQQASYIGHKGSTEPATYEGNGQYSGRYLSPGEQLTIAVGFTPGIVSTEEYVSKWDTFRNIAPFVLYFVYLGFLIWAWHKKGRDPAGRAIMPQYEPPTELTAAQAACLYNKGITENIAPISLLQMVTNGFLKLTTKKEKILIFSRDVYILEKIGKTPSNFEENCIFMDKIKLDGEYNSSIKKLTKRIKSKIKKTMKPYYTKNRAWVLCPTFLLLFSLFLIWGWEEGLFQKEGRDIFFILLVISGSLTFLGSSIFKTFLRQLLHALIFVFLIFFLLNVKGNDPEPLLVLFIISTCSIFSFLMYQPTEKGQRLIEYLEGLKMFLKATKIPAKEKGELCEKKMEKLFPYAMALGLEKEWEKKFKGLFGIEAHRHFVHSHPYTSASFVRSFSSTTSSSSGSSGGGGSGGGGGAGGGGGGGGGGGR